MRQDGFFDLLARQVRADLAHAPATLRRRISDAGRVERCGNIAELRALGRRRVPGVVFDYVDGAAWDELTAERNQADLRRLAVLPHVLTGAADIDLSTTALGQPVAVPLMGAPTGMTGIVHHDGEVALARAVHGAGGLHVLSSVASRTVEEVMHASPGPLWLQLYVSRDRGYVRELLGRARSAGYLALVITVDVQRAGGRERDRRNQFSLPPRLSLRTLSQGAVRPRWSADFIRRPRFLSEGARRARASQSGAGQASLTAIINSQFDPGLSWSDISWVQEQWEGPIVLKGVLRAEDAQQAARVGVRGVIVSNHGGRQLDHAPSTISVLPAVVDAVGSEIEVYMDGGIRRGVDILKALAMGARACLSGRALVYGLAAGGGAGAVRAMSLLVDELRLAMALAGCGSVRELDRSWLTTTPETEWSAEWSTR
jgi:L-lactate dehydrogenase (cytochrome)